MCKRGTRIPCKWNNVNRRFRWKSALSHPPNAKPVPTLPPDLTLLQRMVTTITARITPLTVKHLVLDGHFGTYPATYVVRECGLHIISKLRHDAALYLPYTGPKPPRGPTPRYGEKLNYAHLPVETLCHSIIDDEYQVDTYQLRVFHPSFPDALNVVVVVKTHLKTEKRGHVVLFSTDLDLTAHQIVDYYSLRFQIEFTFRDAKQYWGLDDFMNVKPVAVTGCKQRLSGNLGEKGISCRDRIPLAA
jgi:putative transposase